MKTLKSLRLLITAGFLVASFTGCSNQERVALGAIAGGSAGALASDTTNRDYYSGGYGGGYGGGYRQTTYQGGYKGGYRNYQYRDTRYRNSSQVDGRSYPATERPSYGQYPRY